MSDRRDPFRERFTRLFDDHYPRILRYLDRAGGDPELAADLAQETFVRLYRRGGEPEDPEAWLITVALNLLRNARSKRARRARLLVRGGTDASRGDAPPPPGAVLEAGRIRARVRAALDGLSERERDLLLLRAEGYSHRELGRALGIRETSVGQLLLRARRQFKDRYGEADDG